MTKTPEARLQLPRAPRMHTHRDGDLRTWAQEMEEFIASLVLELERYSDIWGSLDLSTFIEASDVTFENLDTNGDVGTGATQVAQGDHTHAASDVDSGTFADARIAESNVTQHEAALSVTESQITDLGATSAEVKSLTPASDQDDYATGAATSKYTYSIIDLALTASIKITGISTASWETGKRILIRNSLSPTAATARMVLLERNSSSSTAANRFNYRKTGVPLILLPGEMAEFYFDGTDLVLQNGVEFVRRQTAFDIFGDGHHDVFTSATSGTGASQGRGFTFLTASGFYEGCQRLETGTTTSGFASWLTNSGVTGIDDGCHVQMGRLILEDLATAGEDFEARFGRVDSSDAPANGVYWEYNRANSTDFQFVTVSSSTETRTTVTGATVHADDAMDLGIFINGDGSRMEGFYSLDNGETWTVNAVAHTTNLPAGNDGAGRITIEKTAGTTNRQLYIPYMGWRGHVNA